MILRTRSEAERDFAEAIEFYIEEETHPSARRFKEEVDRVYDLIAEDPYRYPADKTTYEHGRSTGDFRFGFFTRLTARKKLESLPSIIIGEPKGS